MLDKQQSRCTVLAQCIFEPDLCYLSHLPTVLAHIQKNVRGQKLDMPHWNVNAQRAILRNPNEGVVLAADHKSVQVETLGLKHWSANQDKYTNILGEMLHCYEVTTCKMLRLDICVFLDVGMSHAEIADLFFDSFLPGHDRYASLGIQFDDSYTRLIGSRGNDRVSLHLAPMKAEEVTEEVKRKQNISMFTKDLPFDDTLKRWHDDVARDCFHIRIENARMDASVRELNAFFSDATSFFRKTAEELVNLLKSIPNAEEEPWKT